jgi:hypothetical protein
MFPLISSVTPQVLVLRLAATTSSICSSHTLQAVSSQLINPPTFFSELFIYGGEQGGGATVLGEGCDIVTGENCDCYSLNVNILGKAAVLPFALAPFCGLGYARLSLQII